MCAKRLAEELNEGFIEDYSTPSKKPRTALKRVEEMWDKPHEKLEKVDNPTETDETENEKNELVILDCADN